MDVVHLHVHTCRCAHFPYFGNGWKEFAGILCVVRDPLASRFIEVKSGVHLHASTYTRADSPRFPISETTGRIALEFGMHLETHQLSILQRVPLARCFTELKGGACVHLRSRAPPFKHLRNSRTNCNGWTNGWKFGVCLGTTSYPLHTRWGISSRAHV